MFFVMPVCQIRSNVAHLCRKHSICHKNTAHIPPKLMTKINAKDRFAHYHGPRHERFEERRIRYQ